MDMTETFCHHMGPPMTSAINPINSAILMSGSSSQKLIKWGFLFFIFSKTQGQEKVGRHFEKLAILKAELGMIERNMAQPAFH